MSVDDDEYWYQIDAAMQQLVEDSLKQVSKENVQGYLGKYGDAVSERIGRCRDDAIRLRDLSFNAPSVIAAATAMELTLRYLVVTPLVQGAFLSEEWASILTARIAAGRSAEDRKLLPAILAKYDIDVNSLRLLDGSHLWETYQKKVLETRNRVVHLGDPCDRSDADLALQYLSSFDQQLVQCIAEKMGFTLDRTGCWARTDWSDSSDPAKGSGGSFYQPDSPFSG